MIHYICRIVIPTVCLTLVLATTASHAEPPPPAISAYQNHGPAKIQSVKLTPDQPISHQRAEFRVKLAAEYTNPFDSQQVRLDGHVVAPSGKQYDIPGFYMLGYDRPELDKPRDHATDELTRNRDDGWRIRFQPQEPGEHTFWLTLTAGGKTVTTDKTAFTVLKTDAQQKSDGRFVRVSEKNPLAFAYDDGKPFIPIGMNVAFPDWGGSYFYDHYWSELASHGANFARIWMAPTFKELCLVRQRDDAHPTGGLGYIDQAAAWRIDHLVDTAAKDKLRVMLCIESYNELRTGSAWPAWQANPYNAVNGGFLQKPQDFWTDARAREMFQNRLRYIVARWGYSPNVFAWEFWNEVDMVDGFKDIRQQVAQWHDSMAKYIKAIDPYHHMVTTSTSTPGSIAYYGATRLGWDDIDSLASLDFGQVHIYDYENLADTISTAIRLREKKYDKPQIVGEFSAGAMPGKWRDDKRGVNLHIGLWSAALLPTPATAMTWWWDSYVDDFGLYSQFASVSAFMDGVDVVNNTATPIDENYQARLDRPAEAAAEQPLRVQGIWASWEPGRGNRPTQFSLLPNGALRGYEDLSCLMFPKGNDLHNPVTFNVHYARPARFTVHVNKISSYGGATLKISLDGDTVLNKNFKDSNGTDEGGDVDQYLGDYSIDVPAGEHKVTVTNEGESWEFLSYELIGLYHLRQPWYRVQGMVFSDVAIDSGHPIAIGWIKNRDWTWKRDMNDVQITAVPPSTLTLHGIPEGIFRVQWWDTTTGKHHWGPTLHSNDGGVAISVPAVQTDLAFKLMPATESQTASLDPGR